MGGVKGKEILEESGEEALYMKENCNKERISEKRGKVLGQLA